MTKLVVENFAHIERAEIQFGDLTILVGAQGTGKSLLLQWLKIALDGAEIVGRLRDAGQDVGDPGSLVDLIFGVGMGQAYSDQTKVTFDNKVIKPSGFAKRGAPTGSAFFIPAHRSMLISDGWAQPFQRLGSDVPVVARVFSQALYDRFTSRDAPELFPLNRMLKRVYRDRIDASVFHGGTVGIETDKKYAKRLELRYGKARLPYMTWSAGQREFTPLLLGLYQVLLPRKKAKRDEIDWVVIEEPEMGLHPEAITVFMLLVLDLIWRGYKVVLATHSPLVLMAAWMLRQLGELGAPWKRVCHAFDIPTTQMSSVAKAALTAEYRTHLLEIDNQGRVHSRDISSLDPADPDDAVSGWGGLTGFASRFGDEVRAAAEEAEQ
jgi:hypothetical protein